MIASNSDNQVPLTLSTISLASVMKLRSSSSTKRNHKSTIKEHKCGSKPSSKLARPPLKRTSKSVPKWETNNPSPSDRVFKVRQKDQRWFWIRILIIPINLNRAQLAMLVGLQECQLVRQRSWQNTGPSNWKNRTTPKVANLILAALLNLMRITHTLRDALTLSIVMKRPNKIQTRRTCPTS